MIIIDFLRSCARRTSLKTKVALAFCIIMGLLLFRVSSYNQYYMVEVQGQEKIKNQLRAASTYFAGQTELFDLKFEALVREADHNDISAASFERLFAETKTWNNEVRPDTFFFVETSGNIMYSANHTYTREENLLSGRYFLALPSVQAAMAGRRVVGFETMPDVLLINEGLYDKAAVKIASRDTTQRRKVLDKALVIAAAAPVYNEGKLAGALVAQKVMNNDVSLVDAIKEAFGCDVTIFLGDIGVATTITDKNGIRGSGNLQTGEVQNQVLNKGQNYAGRVYIIDKWYLTGYEPIKDLQNTVIGAFYVGVKEATLVEKSKLMNGEISQIMVLVTLVFIGIFIWLYRSVIIPVGKISSHALEVSTGKKNVRIPSFTGKACWNFKNCNMTDCSLYGKESVKCWLVSGTKCCNLYDDAEKQDKCHKCRYYKCFAGDEIQRLVDSFNYMAASVEEQTASLQNLNVELEQKNWELTDQRDEVEAQRQELLALNEELEESMKALDDSQSIIYALAVAVEAKDPYTRGHSERVAEYSLTLAKGLGMPFYELETIKGAALLHDIGKIGVSEAILRKPGALTAAEFQQVTKHPGVGERICSSLKFAREMLPIIRHHHEHFDGKGYPDGLKDDRIPYLARVVAVADAFDAMTSDRPYRTGMTALQALDVLKSGAGTQWDPEMVERFSELILKQLKANAGSLNVSVNGERKLLNESS